MNQETVQKLHTAIEKRVAAEIAWHDCLNHPRGQLPEHRDVLEKLTKCRRAVARILEREFDPDTYCKVLKAQRRAFVETAMASASDFV